MSVRTRWLQATVFAFATVTFAGCRGGGDQPPSPTPTATPSATAPTPTETPTPTPAPLTAQTARGLVEVTSIPVPANARLGWSADGSVLVFGEREFIRTDVALGSPKRTSAPSGTQILAVSPDGHTVAVVGLDTGALLLWDLDTPDLTPRTVEGARGRTSASFTGDGAHLIVTEDSTIAASVFDVRTSGKVGTLTGFQTAAPVYTFIIGPTDTGAWHARATVQFAQIPSGTLGARLSFEDFVGEVSFTRDGRLLLTTTGMQENGKIVARLQAWDPGSGTERLRVTLPEVGARATLSADGALVAVAGNGGARILDSMGAQVWTDTKHGAATTAVFTADRRALLVIAEGALRRYEVPR